MKTQSKILSSTCLTLLLGINLSLAMEPMHEDYQQGSKRERDAVTNNDEPVLKKTKNSGYSLEDISTTEKVDALVQKSLNGNQDAYSFLLQKIYDLTTSNFPSINFHMFLNLQEKFTLDVSSLKLEELYIILSSDKIQISDDYAQKIIGYLSNAPKKIEKNASDYLLGLYFLKTYALKEALGYLTELAKNNFIRAQYDLSFLHYHGLDVEKNHELAFMYRKKAAKQKFAPAQYILSMMYYHGQGVEKNDALSFDWCQKAALQGHAQAQYRLSIMYVNGHGVEKNDQLDFEWCQKAALQGHAQAQYRLSFRYHNGQGVEKNDQLDFEWCQKAALQGHAQAQLRLSFMYVNGHGVEKNHQLAFKWCQKAALQGFAQAQKRITSHFLSQSDMIQGILSDKTISDFNEKHLFFSKEVLALIGLFGDLELTSKKQALMGEKDFKVISDYLVNLLHILNTLGNQDSLKDGFLINSLTLNKKLNRNHFIKDGDSQIQLTCDKDKNDYLSFSNSKNFKIASLVHKLFSDNEDTSAFLNKIQFLKNVYANKKIMNYSRQLTLVDFLNGSSNLMGFIDAYSQYNIKEPSQTSFSESKKKELEHELSLCKISFEKDALILDSLFSCETITIRLLDFIKDSAPYRNEVFMKSDNAIRKAAPDLMK